MRRCLIEPIQELEQAAAHLSAAADALLLNNMLLAAEYIVRADDPAIMQYAIRIVGKMSVEVHRQTRRPESLPKADRVKARMPTQDIETMVFVRDGWCCRFCGTKVIAKRVRSKLIQLFPNETRWTSREYEKHAALYAMGVSLDHVAPHSRGGTNEISNFVTTCYCCQFGRGQWTLEEMELNDPREIEPLVSEWDGLTRLNNFSVQPNNSFKPKPLRGSA
jgi:hypothetical protein